ncbi:MAG: YkvA family protein [Myxococcota bacterium]
MDDETETLEYPLQPIEVYDDFYEAMRSRLDKQAATFGKARENSVGARLLRGVMFLPDLFHLTVKLVFDRSFPADRKGALIAGLAYAISPLDLIPDVIPVFGWFDDAIVLTLALRHALDMEDEAVRKAIGRHWVGDERLFSTLQHVLDVAESAIEFLPKRIIALLKPIIKLG